MRPARSGMAADLLNRSDTMLYQAKREGRDRAAISAELESMQQTGTTLEIPAHCESGQIQSVGEPWL